MSQLQKLFFGGFAEAEVLKNSFQSGVEGKHCGVLQFPQIKEFISLFFKSFNPEILKILVQFLRILTLTRYSSVKHQ
jgi:hypothetical protein